jgi:hypothetical protein
VTVKAGICGQSVSDVWITHPFSTAPLPTPWDNVVYTCSTMLVCNLYDISTLAPRLRYLLALTNAEGEAPKRSLNSRAKCDWSANPNCEATVTGAFPSIKASRARSNRRRTT